MVCVYIYNGNVTIVNIAFMFWKTKKFCFDEKYNNNNILLSPSPPPQLLLSVRKLHCVSSRARPHYCVILSDIFSDIIFAHKFEGEKMERVFSRPATN